VQPTTRAAGVAINDDPGLEREADAMGARALQMRADPASPTPTVRAAPAAKTAQTAQLYKTTKPPTFRVSDTLTSAVSQDGNGGGQTFYATPAIIDAAENKLLAASSAVSLKKNGDTFDYYNKKLAAVQPSLRDKVVEDCDTEQIKKLKTINSGIQEDDDGVTDDVLLALWTDCGKAARTIMGIEGTGKNPKAHTKLGDSKPSDVPEEFSNEVFPKGLKAFFGVEGNEAYMTENIHYKIRKNAKVLIEPATAAQAKKMYWALGPQGRAAFDKHVGINRNVNPEIGEAYTMVTEKDMPGFDEGGFTWGFHWAGVIAKDGSDNITLEGYAMNPLGQIMQVMQDPNDPDLDAKIEQIIKKTSEYISRAWVFQMYGQDNGQTFHDEHLNSGTHGNRATTMNVKPTDE
jgi:hypothetical protein